MEQRKIGPYIPTEWVEEAAQSEVSNAEWYRRMIRAGRRQWGYDHIEEPEEPGLQFDEPGQASDHPAGDLRESILRNLSTTDGVDQEELAELLLDDLQDQMEVALQDLKDDGKVDIDLNKGGWIKTE